MNLLNKSVIALILLSGAASPTARAITVGHDRMRGFEPKGAEARAIHEALVASEGADLTDAEFTCRHSHPENENSAPACEVREGGHVRALSSSASAVLAGALERRYYSFRFSGRVECVAVGDESLCTLSEIHR